MRHDSRGTPRVVRNTDPSRGQLSSLWVGLEARRHRSIDAVLMTLVDVPMDTAATVRAVMDEWRRATHPSYAPPWAIGTATPCCSIVAVFAGAARRAARRRCKGGRQHDTSISF